MKTDLPVMNARYVSYMQMVLFPVNPISALDPGKDWMEFVIEEETCARIMLTVERMEKSAALMAVRKIV